MPLNTGALALGLANTATNVMKTIPDIYKTQAQTELIGKQARAADYAQAMKEASQDAVNFIAQNAGIDKRFVQGSSDPTEIMNRLRANAQMRGYQAAGMLDPVVQQVINKVQQNQASLPQASSYSEDASVTPSIASLKLKGNNSYREAPPPDNQSVRNQVQENTMRNGALLRQIIQDTGAIENALKGNGMYKSTPNGGYFNTFYGDGGVYDDVARAIYQNDKQSQIENRNNQITNRNERTRIAKNKKTTGRGRPRVTYGKPQMRNGREVQVASNGRIVPVPMARKSSGGGAFSDDVPGI